MGPLLLYTNGLVQHAGVYFSVITRRFDHRYRLAPRALAQVQKGITCPVTGALQYIRYETIKKIGIYDENFKMGYEDIDISGGGERPETLERHVQVGGGPHPRRHNSEGLHPSYPHSR